MTGKAHNPKMFKEERDHHEAFNGLPQEAIEKLREYTHEGKAKALKMPDKLCYDTLWQMHKDKRSGQVGHFIFEMFYDIYMGIEDELVANSIDTQVRCYPDYVPRAANIIDYSIKASQAGMRAFISQDHFFPTVGQAWGAQQKVDEMYLNGELDHTVEVLGCHVFSWSHHPDQVHMIQKYPNLGACLFYCQTYGGKNCGPVVNMFDEKGKIHPEVRHILKLCADYKIAVMSGHATMYFDQFKKLAQVASEYGTHVMWMHAAPWAAHNDRATLKEYKELIKLGAYLQCDANKILPSIIWPMTDPNIGLQWMADLGPDHIIPCTDGGQPFIGDAVDMWKMFVRAMIHFGLGNENIKQMIQTNPAEFLYLPEKRADTPERKPIQQFTEINNKTTITNRNPETKKPTKK